MGKNAGIGFCSNKPPVRLLSHGRAIEAFSYLHCGQLFEVLVGDQRDQMEEALCLAAFPTALAFK